MASEVDLKISTDTAGLNQALFHVTHGLYILTAARPDKLNGQCLDALMQVTNVPPKISIGVGKKTLTHEIIQETGKFVINVLDKCDDNWMAKVKNFGFKSGRTCDKFEDFPYELGENGAPILADIKSFYEGEIIPELTQDLVTHTLFVAKVTRAGVSGPCEPVTYNEYRKLKTK